jgi:hypothetical protein
MSIKDDEEEPQEKNPIVIKFKWATDWLDGNSKIVKIWNKIFKKEK